MYTLKPLPKDPSKYVSVISEQVVLWHHDTHQNGYVNKLNEIDKKLLEFDKTQANANYSDWSDAKRRESFNKAGIVLHEIYWEVFGADGKYKSSDVVEQMEKDFETFENWKSDFIATAKSSLGWALLIFDRTEGKLKNVLVDMHNNGAFWNSDVIIALDVFEHAYYKDYGPNRAEYITKFMDSLDFDSIDKLFES